MPQNLESADCNWRVQEVGTVAISHEEADINNVVCLRSIAEIQRGNSNDVFCEFRRSNGTM